MLKTAGKDSKQYITVIIFAVFLILGFGCRSTRTGNNSQGTVMPDRNARKLLLRDEGLSQLSYVDLANPATNWYLPVPVGRDLQLVGNGLVLIGTGTGYEEREIATGKKVNEQNKFPGTVAARRLRNGNTLLTGTDWQGKQGIVLVEVDKNGTVQKLTNFPQFNYVRLVRETTSGTYLVTADDTVVEANAAGTILWQGKIKLTDRAKPHVWQALRTANGQTIVSGGYTGNFQVFGADGNFLSAFTGPAEVKPNFFAGFQILANGNYIVTNWQGHGAKFGASGNQLLEFNPSGELVWSWKQDPLKFSSLQGVLVLDGLDINQLHIEDARGVLAPVKSVR